MVEGRGSIRSVEAAAGPQSLHYGMQVSCIDGEAGTIPILTAIPAGVAYKVTGVQMIVTGLISGTDTSLIKVTDGTNDITADHTFTGGTDLIGAIATPTVDSDYEMLGGSDKLEIVTTGGSATTGSVMIRVELEKAANNM